MLPETPVPEEFKRLVQAQKNPLEIKIANVDLPTKIMAICGALHQVRLAHRDTISDRTWELLNRCEDLLCEASLTQSASRWGKAKPDSSEVFDLPE